MVFSNARDERFECSSKIYQQESSAFELKYFNGVAEIFENNSSAGEHTSSLFIEYIWLLFSAFSSIRRVPLFNVLVSEFIFPSIFLVREVTIFVKGYYKNIYFTSVSIVK